MKKPSPSTHAVHHLAIQKHFACGPDAYQTDITPDSRGMNIMLDDVAYRVETIADRVEQCREDLVSLESAREVDFQVAEWVLEGLENEEDFFRKLLHAFEDADEAAPAGKGRALQRRVNLALALGISQATDQPLSHALRDVDEDLVAAALVVARQLDEGGRLPSEMAAVYFRLGDTIFGYAEGGLVTQVSVQETTAIIYDIDPDLFDIDSE